MLAGLQENPFTEFVWKAGNHAIDVYSAAMKMGYGELTTQLIKTEGK